MTTEERQQLKAAKSLYKQEQQNQKLQRLEWEQRRTEEAKKPKPIFINTGILPGENILPDNYPVYWDYLYVIDEDGGKVVRSDVKGTVATLKQDLIKIGHKFTNVHNCLRFDRIKYPSQS